MLKAGVACDVSALNARTQGGEDAPLVFKTAYLNLPLSFVPCSH